MQNHTRKMSGQYRCFKCHFSKIEKWHFFIFPKKFALERVVIVVTIVLVYKGYIRG